MRCIEAVFLLQESNALSLLGRSASRMAAGEGPSSQAKNRGSPAFQLSPSRLSGNGTHCCASQGATFDVRPSARRSPTALVFGADGGCTTGGLIRDRRHRNEDARSCLVRNRTHLRSLKSGVLYSCANRHCRIDSQKRHFKREAVICPVLNHKSPERRTLGRGLSQRHQMTLWSTISTWIAGCKLRAS